jgi:endonuclease YncB( thermonuclease family)
MSIKKALSLLLFITFTAHSQDTVNVTRIISVYDGDTFRVDIDELSDIVDKNIAIRILGIDTPEIRGQCEKEKQLAIKT